MHESVQRLSNGALASFSVYAGGSSILNHFETLDFPAKFFFSKAINQWFPPKSKEEEIREVVAEMINSLISETPGLLRVNANRNYDILMTFINEDDMNNFINSANANAIKTPKGLYHIPAMAVDFE